MTPESHDTGFISLSALRKAEQACTHFEAAWREGERPCIEAYLTEETNEDPSLLLGELLKLELELRQEAGESPDLQTYAERFPNYADVVAAAFREGSCASGPAPLRYAIVRPHARGGLGEVFVARDEELHRLVALKRLQERLAGDTDSRRRFLREAEITARLEHPGVVPIYGMMADERGQPCYAMRFVEGETLLEAIGRFHGGHAGLEDSPRGLAREASYFGSVEFRRLLHSFITVCNTVAYAHSRGIVHRDLKPANIMLGTFGETLVLDWGLAKDLGQSAPSGGEADSQSLAATGDFQSRAADDDTQMGAALGTPGYMSPEQAGGRWDVLDHASDIYSLGATLYHLLTGRPPFGHENFPALRARIERGWFPRPREISSRIPAPLEAVCLKAMALEPQHRYASASNLAGDLERWLADEPVSARRDSWPVRLGRWGRRHRVLVASAGVLLLTASLALAISTVLINEQRSRAVENHLKAEANYQIAREAVERYFTNVSQNRLLNEPGMEPLRRELFAAAKEFYERFVQERGDDPQARLELGSAYLRLGWITGEIESVPRGIEYLMLARDTFRLLADDQPNEPEIQYKLARSLLDLGALYRQDGRPEPAAAALREATERLEALTSIHTKEEYRNDLGLACFHQGALHLFDNRLAESNRFFERGQETFQELAEEHPENTGYQSHLASAANALGASHFRAGNTAEAERAYRRALAIRDRLVKREPAVKEYRYLLGEAENNLGQLFTNTRRYDDAQKAFARAIDVRTQLCHENPTVAKYKAGLATVLMNLGVLHWQRSDFEGAIPVYQKALSLWEELAKQHPTVTTHRASLARTLQNLGSVQQSRGRWLEAAVMYERATTITEELLSQQPDAPRYLRDLGGFYRSLAFVKANAGDRDGARADYERAVAKYESLWRQPPVNVLAQIEFAETLRMFGAFLREQGDAKPAVAQFDRSGTMLKPIHEQEPRNPRVQEALIAGHHGRALALAQLGKPRDGVPDWDEAIELAEGPRKTALEIERASATVSAGGLSGLLALVDASVERSPDSGDVLYAAAAAHATAIDVLAGDSQLSATDQADRAKLHVERAAEFLNRAQRAGHFQSRSLRQELDKDFRFEKLRGRADFQRMLENHTPKPASNS